MRGQRIRVSGTVSLPKGRAPRGGWPVISWAHGTTGTADVCAPRDVRLRAALALAPGSQTSKTPGYIKAGHPGAEIALPFLFTLLTGAEAADPSLVPEELLTGVRGLLLLVLGSSAPRHLGL